MSEQRQERRQAGLPWNGAIGVAAVLVAAWGCEPQPPEACGRIQGQTVNVRQVVRVTPCFTDPDGGELALSAESSDPAVVAVSMGQTEVTVRGAGVGDATVTVTATDRDGLQGGTNFGVTVPNRPPELTTPFGAVKAEIGDSLVVGLGAHFTDPDGHTINFRIGSVDTSTVAAVVKDSRLQLSGRTPGRTEVTVIADDGWDSAEGTIPVEVPVPVRSFRDDFDSEASLDDWAVVRADVSVEDGRLLVSPDTADEGYAHYFTGEAPEASSWRIKVSMASADSSGMAGVRWQAEGGDDDGYYFAVGALFRGDVRNWELGYCVGSGSCWWSGGQHGWSDEIEVGVLREFHIWMDDDLAYIRIGEDGPWLLNGVKPGNVGRPSNELHGRIELGAFDRHYEGLAAVYDWVELVVR